MSAKSIILAAGVAAFLGQPLSADEKWVSGFPGELDLKLNQLYKIATGGPNAIPQAPKINEKGTAFAITPTMLITARHVTRNAGEFANVVAGGKIFIPNRTVTYDFARDKTTAVTDGPFKVASVTPAATPTIDASRLNLGNAQTAPFKLSVCPIKEGGQYYLLKFRDGKIDIPRIVPITADVEAYTDHGEARQFTHNAQALDAPRPGDSGAPVLNEQGHVVGLLTAIKETEQVLYVTMTRSFMDLVPSGVNVECADRVNRNQFERLSRAVSASNEQSQAERDDIRRRLEGRLEELQTRFDDKTTAMQTTIDELVAENAELGELLELATEVVDKAIRVLAKIDEEGLVTDLDPEKREAIMAGLKSQNPVLPRVDLMFKDLGIARWSFSAFADKNDLMTVNATYERNISRPRYAEEVTFCVRPLTEAETLDAQDELNDMDNVYSQKFYRATDRMSPGEAGLDCRTADHPLAPVADRNVDGFNPDTYPFKEGEYVFYPLDVAPPRYAETPKFTGLFYGFMYVDDGSDKKDITHRFIFDINSEEDSDVLKCYVFEDDNGRGDTFATFVQANQNERNSATLCSDL